MITKGSQAHMGGTSEYRRRAERQESSKPNSLHSWCLVGPQEAHAEPEPSMRIHPLVGPE